MSKEKQSHAIVIRKILRHATDANNLTRVAGAIITFDVKNITASEKFVLCDGN